MSQAGTVSSSSSSFLPLNHLLGNLEMFFPLIFRTVADNADNAPSLALRYFFCENEMVLGVFVNDTNFSSFFFFYTRIYSCAQFL